MKREVMPVRSYRFPVFAIRAAAAALMFWGWTTVSGCAASPTTARIALVPDGPEEWTDQLEEAIGYWNDALLPRCGDVFELEATGLPVRLYKTEWPEGAS